MGHSAHSYYTYYRTYNRKLTQDPGMAKVLSGRYIDCVIPHKLIMLTHEVVKILYNVGTSCLVGLTFFEFHSALWLARFMNLYTRSGLFKSLAREHSSLYVERLPPLE